MEKSRKPLLSIIVPVYNIMEYLPRCVESLTGQTYEKIEILLVDDGSTDGTAALCDQLSLEDTRIRVFHKENGGSSSARNLGIENARGEYLGFVDSDDYVAYNMYELLLDGILKYQVRAAQIGRDELDEEGRSLPDICVPPLEAVCISEADFMKELLMHRGDCSFCTKLLHRDLFAEKRFPLGVLNEDFHLLVQLLPEIGSIVSLPQQAYHVFCRMGSNTRRQQGFSRVFADNVDNADMVSRITAESYPQLREIAFRFGVFQRIDYLLHIPIPDMNGDNEQYTQIVSYLRHSWLHGMKNQFLTDKNKLYMTLFAIAPKTVRRLHRKLKKL